MQIKFKRDRQWATLYVPSMLDALLHILIPADPINSSSAVKWRIIRRNHTHGIYYMCLKVVSYMETFHRLAYVFWDIYTVNLSSCEKLENLRQLCVQTRKIRIFASRAYLFVVFKAHLQPSASLGPTSWLHYERVFGSVCRHVRQICKE